jgi:hypothetical protein
MRDRRKKFTIHKYQLDSDGRQGKIYGFWHASNRDECIVDPLVDISLASQAFWR